MKRRNLSLSIILFRNSSDTILTYKIIRSYRASTLDSWACLHQRGSALLCSRCGEDRAWTNPQQPWNPRVHQCCRVESRYAATSCRRLGNIDAVSGLPGDRLSWKPDPFSSLYLLDFRCAERTKSDDVRCILSFTPSKEDNHGITLWKNRVS